MRSVKVTRRQFLKWLTASAAALGLSQTDLLKVEKALAAGPTPDPNFPIPPLGRVIWIAGAACSGCPTSLLNYIADPNDCETVLNAIGNNALGLWSDIESLYPVSNPGANFGPDLTPLTPDDVGDGHIDIAEVVLEVITIDYSQIVMAASGDIPNNYLISLLADPDYKYVLLVEGTIQTAKNGKYCRIMDVPGDLTATAGWPAAATPYVDVYTDPDLGTRTDVTMAGGTLWLASSANCLAVVTLGTCASFGGVPAAKGSVTGGKSAWEWINKINGLKKLLVNVPGCPPHPDWFMATVGAALLQLNAVPGFETVLTDNLNTALDHKGRPKLTYNGVNCTIYHPDGDYVFCLECPRRLSQPGPASLCAARKSAVNPEGLCMWATGCMGRHSAEQNVRADCPTRKWNPIESYSGGPPGTLTLTKNNWCVGNNMPCQGCTDPGFPDMCSPFYDDAKNI